LPPKSPKFGGLYHEIFSGSPQLEGLYHEIFSGSPQLGGLYHEIFSGSPQVWGARGAKFVQLRKSYSYLAYSFYHTWRSRLMDLSSEDTSDRSSHIFGFERLHRRSGFVTAMYHTISAFRIAASASVILPIGLF
jgi:hypothetical protein